PLDAARLVTGVDVIHNGFCLAGPGIRPQQSGADLPQSFQNSLLVLPQRTMRLVLHTRHSQMFYLQSRYITCSCVSASGLLTRSEEHTSELQSREKLVCRLLLE